MPSRSDGIETRGRILQAATEVFAAKGFRDATVADICRAAGVNTALVNYHFRDKESLYVAVWKHAAALVNELYPLDGGVPADAPVEERFRGHVRALLNRVMDRGRLGCFHRLRMQELAAPTGHINRIRGQIIGPMREYSLGLIRELLGPRATARDVELCHLSIFGPCLMAGHLAGREAPVRSREVETMSVDELVAHMTAFALAGIRDVRARIEARNRKGKRKAKG